MDDAEARERAAQPEDLSRFVLERLNTGMSTAWQPCTSRTRCRSFPSAGSRIGHEQIRRA